MDDRTYAKFENVILLVEDDPEQRANLEKTARRYLEGSPGAAFCVAENTTAALDELEKYMKESPTAKITAVLDYNMGLSETGHKRPTEMLFYHDFFRHFLNNGGIVIIYSGYPEQVWQSQEIISSPGKYENLALLVAEKSAVRMEDVFRLLKGTPKEAIGKLRKAADRYQLNLGKIIEAYRSAKK